jgi:tape measure domain-containing protein
MAVIASQLIAKVGSQGVDSTTRQLREVGTQAKTTQGSFSEMKTGSEEASSSLGGHLLGALRSVGSGFVSTISHAGLFIGGLKGIYDAGISLVGGLIAPNAAMEQMRVSFSAFIPDAKQLTSTLTDLKKFSATTPFESKEVNQSALSLLNMDVQAQDLNKWLGNIGASVSKIGGSGQVFEDVTAIISQMGVKGKVTTEEMQQLTDRNIPAFKILAQAMNVPVATLQDMISRGELGKDKIELLVQSMGKFGGDAMVKQGQTFNGLLSTVKDNASMALAAFTGPLFDAAKGGLTILGNLLSSQAFQDFATGAGQRVADVFGLIGRMTSHLLGPLNECKEMITEVGRIILFTFNDEPLGVFEASLSNLGDAINSKVMPVLKSFGAIVDQHVWHAIDNMHGPLVEISGQFYKVADAVDEVTRFVKGFNFSQATSSLKEFESPARTIASLLQGQFVDAFKFASKEAKQIGTWFTGSGIIKDVGQEFKNLLGITLNLAEIFTRARGVIQDVEEHAFAKFAPYIEKILPPLIKFQTAIDTGIAGALQYIKPYIDQALQAFGQFADGVIDRVTPIIDKFMPYLISGAQETQKIFEAVFPYLLIIVKGVFDMMAGSVQIAWSLISGIINIGLDLLSGNWSGAWQDMQNMLGGVWEGIKKVIGGGIDAARGALSGVQAFVDKYLVGPFRGALGSIGDVFGAIAKLITDTSLLNFGAIPGDLHNLHIPGFASGTDYAPGGWGIVGERGPEAMYIPRGSRIVPASQTAQMMQPQIIVMPPDIVLDGQRLTRAQMPYIVGAIRNSTGTRI